MSSSENNIEMVRLLSLLQQLAQMSENASLTGSLEGGAKSAVRRYNAILDQLLQQGQIPHGMFEPLPEGTGFGELGVESQMLSAYLRPKGERRRHVICCNVDDDEAEEEEDDDFNLNAVLRLAPFVSSEDLGEMVRTYLSENTRIGAQTLQHLAPFLDRETLGDLMRTHLSAAKARHNRTEAPKAPEAPAAPAAPAAPTEPEPGLVRTPRSSDGDLADQILTLTQHLADITISDEERHELALELVRLGRQQALESGQE